MARAKALERIRGTGSTGRRESSRGSSQAPSTGRQTTQASQRQPKPRAFVEQTKETKQRHRASLPLEQPSAKRTALEKEKGIADGSANPMDDASQSLPGLNIPEWTRRQRERMFDLPELSDPRFFDVSNSHSVFLDPFGRATLDSFRAVLFEKDHERLSGQKTSHLLRLNAFFTLAQIQASYELARRSLSYGRDAKALTKRIEELEASSSRERVEELEARLAITESKVKDLECRQKEAADALKRADTQLLDAVQEKSRLSERIDQLRVEALEARKIGEACGQQNEREAMERFYQGKQPELCLKAAEDFLHSPVFQMVSLLLGSNDQLSGWMKALGQLRRQGVEFDESKLDMGLDEFGNPYAEDDDDDIPQVDGTEFEPLMPAIHQMARAAEEKEANLAEARRLNADGMSTPIPVVQDPATEVEPPAAVVQVEELDHEVVDVPSS